MAIAHDRYTVAFHVTSCQTWVIDSTGHDTPRGPFLASRSAWAEAHDLNHANTANILAASGRPYPTDATNATKPNPANRTESNRTEGK
jgi:hypothetical protein